MRHDHHIQCELWERKKAAVLLAEQPWPLLATEFSNWTQLHRTPKLRSLGWRKTKARTLPKPRKRSNISLSCFVPPAARKKSRKSQHCLLLFGSTQFRAKPPQLWRLWEASCSPSHTVFFPPLQKANHYSFVQGVFGGHQQLKVHPDLKKVKDKCKRHLGEELW